MFKVQFGLGPLTFAAVGAAGVYTGSGGASGLALNLAVSASANGQVFSITASGSLEINTTNVTELGIAANSFSLALNGQVDVLRSWTSTPAWTSSSAVRTRRPGPATASGTSTPTPA